MLVKRDELMPVKAKMTGYMSITIVITIKASACRSSLSSCIGGCGLSFYVIASDDGRGNENIQ